MRMREAAQVREEVARTLSARIGVGDTQSEVLKWLDIWAGERTTPVGGPRSAALVALQLEAHEVFGGGEVEHLAEDAKRRDVLAIRRHDGSFLRALLVQMYLETQEQLKARGIEQITLWRGERGIFSPHQDAFLDIGILPFQPLNSFSHQLAQARRFAGQRVGSLVVVVAPASRILATPATGFGVLQQREELLFAIPSTLNTSDQGLVAQWDDFDLWQEISSYDETDWVELLQAFYQARS